MIKKTITYTDYDGNERTDSFWFNLSKAELAEMELSEDGGLDRLITKIIEEDNNKKLVEFFKKLVLMSYGEKSLDGKRFIKSEEMSTAFSQTEAYSELFMELATDSDKAAEFVNGIIPKSINDKIPAK